MAYDMFGPIPKFDFEDDIDEEDLIKANQAAEALLKEDESLRGMFLVWFLNKIGVHLYDTKCLPSE